MKVHENLRCGLHMQVLFMRSPILGIRLLALTSAVAQARLAGPVLQQRDTRPTAGETGAQAAVIGTSQTA